MPIYGLIENISYYKCPCCSHEVKLFMDEMMPNETIKSKYSLLKSLPIINTKLHIDGINLLKKNSKYFENLCSLIEEKANF